MRERDEERDHMEDQRTHHVLFLTVMRRRAVVSLPAQMKAYGAAAAADRSTRKMMKNDSFYL